MLTRCKNVDKCQYSNYLKALLKNFSPVELTIILTTFNCSQDNCPCLADYHLWKTGEQKTVVNIIFYIYAYFSNAVLIRLYSQLSRYVIPLASQDMALQPIASRSHHLISLQTVKLRYSCNTLNLEVTMLLKGFMIDWLIFTKYGLGTDFVN